MRAERWLFHAWRYWWYRVAVGGVYVGSLMGVGGCIWLLWMWAR
jgi:hypothetical protein